MIATIDDVKWFVWSQYTDEKIQMLLDMTEQDITSITWDISFWIKQETFEICKNNNSLFFKNIWIKKILKINWKEFNWWYDIIEPQKRQVIFDDLWLMIDYNRSVFDVEYLSWYTKIPKDLILAHTLIVVDMLSQWATGWTGGQIKEYKMWPRTIKYDTSVSNVNTSPYKKKAEDILNRYRKFII